jgi:hypothetical protein
MIYLTGVLCEESDALQFDRSLNVDLGVLITPATRRYIERADRFVYGWAAMDTGLFSKRGQALFSKRGYLDLVEEANERLLEPLMWATAPDVPFNWRATMAASFPYIPLLQKRSPVALVVQDGAKPSDIPWNDIATIFVGGSTAWKLSVEAYRIVEAAKERCKNSHMGRVNSLRRLRKAARWGCDTADGTYILHRRRKCGDGMRATEEVADWLYDVNGHPSWHEPATFPEERRAWLPSRSPRSGTGRTATSSSASHSTRNASGSSPTSPTCTATRRAT